MPLRPARKVMSRRPVPVRRCFALLSLVLLPLILAGPSSLCAEEDAPEPPKYETIDESIARGDLDDVKRHLAADPERVNHGKNPKLNPLQQAILRKKTGIAILLLEAGADPDKPDPSKRTPTHLAVERGLAKLIPILLKHKADPNRLDKDGWTPLHHAAAKDNLEVAKALLKGGADPMTRSARGGTPLHEAAASGGREIIQLLLEHKIDPKAKAKSGVTALDVAKENKNQPAIEILESLDE